MKRIPVRICVLLVLLLTASAVTLSQENDSKVRKLYQQGLEQALTKQWDKARVSFQLLLDTYPESEFADDASFWVARCLENTSTDLSQVYQTYQALIDRFPESSWVDNALIQQIELAAQLVRNGQDSYRSFLLSNLENKSQDVKAQAALSLGRLGDGRAAPVLHQMVNDPQNGIEARELIITLAPDLADFDTGVDTMGLHFRTDSTTTKSIPRAKIPFLGILTTEHRTYSAMLKTTDNWNQQELIDFALWYILPPRQFKKYYTLSDQEKKDWILKNWKDADPNPETQVNEALQEFERRIQFAQEHFAGYWNYKQTNYLPKQYQREGWPNAPWDARGEIYIKYGAPDFETLGDGFNEVEWTYYRYNVDFVIHKYMTNFYGNAISLGYLAQNMYGYDYDNMAYHYIEEKQFLYP